MLCSHNEKFQHLVREHFAFAHAMLVYRVGQALLAAALGPSTAAHPCPSGQKNRGSEECKK